MNEITLSAYGKINLCLDVLGKRANGYHDVDMIMQSVTLCDTLTVQKLPVCSDVTIQSNVSSLEHPEQNLAARAASLLKEEFGIKDGISIKLTKRIPIAAGMAGGSTDAAAALKAVNTLFSLGLDEKALASYGVRLGADIPYCLLCGTARSQGIGEILTPLPKAPDCCVLLVNPNIHVSTKQVYCRLDTMTNLEHPDIDSMITAIQKNDYAGIAANLGNILEPVTFKRAPIIYQIKEQMQNLGADGVLMSGSGPTVFGLFSKQEICEQAKAWFLNQNQIIREQWPVMITHFQERI